MTTITDKLADDQHRFADQVTENYAEFKRLAASAHVVQWQKRHPEEQDGRWQNCGMDDAAFWKARPGWEVRALSLASQQAEPEAGKLPPFIRAEVERAIATAKNPSGMSLHDGKAVIGHDKLAYMLALIDSQTTPPAPEAQQAEPSSGSSAAAPVVTPSDARVEAGKAAALASMQEAGIYMSNGWLTEMIGAVLQAADAVSVGAGWRPIETAPKDGTMLLLAGFNFGNPQRGQHITAGSWRNERGWWEGLPDPVAEHLTANTQLNNLTHWMPLPAAPGAEQKEGANG